MTMPDRSAWASSLISLSLYGALRALGADVTWAFMSFVCLMVGLNLAMRSTA